VSETVDVATAKLIALEVSDGIIAPGYDPAALDILKKKKSGGYAILQMDPAYEPGPVETRTVYGLTLQQPPNNVDIVPDALPAAVSSKSDVSVDLKRDMVLALHVLRATQSNSVVYVQNGMVVGLGAGQQSRIHCTRLAGDKADAFALRYHPRVLGLEFKDGVKRAEKANAIDYFVTTADPAGAEYEAWKQVLKTEPTWLTMQEKREWVGEKRGVVVGSDAFFPFADNVHRAARSGVEAIVAPGGSVMVFLFWLERDDERIRIS
jgi:phosphoribosylaminoimidazolecarboxamide formyltransferase/IMP cyclohydrolase